MNKMKIETRNSLVGKLFDVIGINKSFYKYEQVKINNKATIVSPVEAKVVHIGKIDSDGNIISKNHKNVNLKLLIQEYSQNFYKGVYINFYLSPNNKHFGLLLARVLLYILKKMKENQNFQSSLV